ncbi:hypothetical protein [Vagococcus zengguangii]|uniref:hypothetical protein n=1 Tax=Vagococcus zengguangii TaxID=2571750 RepID=UPI0011088C91|nr:hypothetical protein [Vagococcus zengguangii]TLG80948.1 hypothetical protein FE258_03415 [Vagococcus zengguangii]
MLSLSRFLITILIFIEINFFSVVKFPDVYYQIAGYKSKYLTTMICLILLLLNILYYKMAEERIKKNYFFSPLLMFFSSLIIVFIFSYAVYNQSLIQTMKESYYLLIMLSTYFFVTYFSNRNELNYFVKLINWTSTIYALLLIFQIFIFKYKNILFLDFDVRTLGNIATKSYGIRLSRPSDFIMFSILISLIGIKLDRIRLLDICSLMIRVYFLIFISMTRMNIMISFILIIVSFVYSNKTSKKIKQLIINSSIFITLILFSKKIYNFLLNYFFNGVRKSSGESRLLEIDYYTNHIFFNGIFGRGFPSDDKYFSLNHGPEGKYYISDIGVLGFFSVFGALGIVFYISTIYKFILLYLRTSSNKTILLLILLYFVLSSITLFFMDPQRTLYLAIIMALYSVFYVPEKENKGETSL